MALRSLVKISSVNNLSDARYAAGMGVELMGFDLEVSSERYVSPEAFAAITSWVSGAKFVGEIGSGSRKDIKALLEAYQLDYLQFIASPVATFAAIYPIPVIVKIVQSDQWSISKYLQQFSSFARWFLLEPDEPLSEELLEWCMQKTKNYPIILGSNVSQHNVIDLLDLGFKGIALRGGDELRPGYKEFEELASILETLEVDLW